MFKVFVSHSSTDKQLVDALWELGVAVLMKQACCQCWVAERLSGASHKLELQSINLPFRGES